MELISFMIEILVLDRLVSRLNLLQPPCFLQQVLAYSSSCSSSISLSLNSISM
jgi:hypothetical protein